MADAKIKKTRKPPSVDAMLDHLIALERDHGCILVALRGQERFSTAINLRTGRPTNWCA